MSKLPAERFPRAHEAARVAENAATFTFMIDVRVDSLAANLRGGGPA